jgi:hypothetical protein
MVLRTVAISHDSIHGVKYDWVVNHAVVVQLSQIFYLCETSLVELEVVLFESKNDILEKIINDDCNKILVISVKGADKDSK